MSNLKTKLADLIKGFAPTLAAGLCGPASGAALQILSNTLFDKEESSIEEMIKAVAGGEKYLELAGGERKFRLRLKELEIDEAHLIAHSQQQAREAALERTRHQGGNTVMHAIALMVVISFVSMITLFFVSLMQKGNDDHTLSLLMLMANITSGIFSYYFGSSSRLPKFNFGRKKEDK